MRKRVAVVTVFLSALASVTPFLWMVITAFRPRTIITDSPPDFSLHLTWSNFAWDYNGQKIILLLLNSFVLGLGTVLFSILIGAPAAYYFARQRSRLTRVLFVFVLSTRMAPPIALSLPMFVLFTVVGLRGTQESMIITETNFNIAFVVWFLEGSFSALPVEIEMAAQVDGRSRLGALRSVVIPSIMPSLIVTGAFVFLFAWNEYMIASLLSSPDTRPITPALPGFIAQATSQWGYFCAVASLSSIPGLLLAVAARGYLARAFTVGMVPDA